MRLVVLGDPVAHSLSPAIHTAALASVGLTGTYTARRVDAEGMGEAVEQIRRGTLDGANVTMPHKALAASLADQCTTTARRAGAVNTLVRVGTTVVGHNTDVAGVRYAFEVAALPVDAPVLILGAGGAAAAALLACEGRPISLSARRPERAETLAKQIGIAVDIVPWSSAVPGAVVINATSVGMQGEPLPIEGLTGHVGLLDMPYAGGPTPAAEEMRRGGLPVATGEDMLLGQAIGSFRLWTGLEPDATAMRAAMGHSGSVE